VFYVPYILVDVPSNWIVKHFKAGRYLPFLITSWGVVSTFLGFTKSYGGLVAARFFLGLCEGGLLGGMIVYLAMVSLSAFREPEPSVDQGIVSIQQQSHLF
jgi:MFS family permease